MSEDGKKVGVIGGILAALGGAFAHFGDDCARLGARGVSAEAAGVRASNVGDDLARVGARGATRAGEDLTRGSLAGRNLRPRGAPLIAPGAAEDLGRLGSRVPGFERELGLAAVGDEVATGSKTWKSLAEELGHEVSQNVLSELLGPDESEAPSPADRPALPALALPGSLPTLIALVPESNEAERVAFGGSAPKPARGSEGADPPRRLVFVLPARLPELWSRLEQPNALGASVVVGHWQRDRTTALSLPAEPTGLEIATLQARCALARKTCWVLVCANEDEKSRAACGVSARGVIERALSKRVADAAELGRRLVAERDQFAVEALAIHGVARTRGGARLVHSRL